MKVLFLNPHLRADHPVAKGLQSRGLAVLLAANVQEATQMLSLQGAVLDLVVLHREETATGKVDGGFKFLSKLKSDPAHAELPVLITSHVWDDGEFASHQGSPQGVNAYLKWPADAAEVYSMIEAIFGGSIPSSEASRLISLDALGGDEKTRVGGMPLPKPPQLQSQSPSQLTPSIPTATDTGVSQVLLIEDPAAAKDTRRESSGGLKLELDLPDEPESGAGSTADPGYSDGPVIAPTLDAGPDAAEERTRVAVVPKFNPPPRQPQGESIEEAVEATRVGSLDQRTRVAPGIGGAPEIDHLEITTTDGGIAATRVLPQGGLSAALSQVLAQDQANVPESELGDEPPVSEEEAAKDMPYLFRKSGGSPSDLAAALSAAQPAPAPTPVAFALPLGDAVVPGGAAHSPDSDTLKRYLLLREQDVAVLSTQLKAAKEQVHSLESRLREEQGRGAELSHVNGELSRKIEDFDRERQQAFESMQAELGELRFQLKAKSDKARLLDIKVREAAEETERLKERVRTDIRKIRVREKELENRLEIMKKDSEALIAAREGKIIELKRKLDLLEFNMDLLQDQYAREKENSAKVRERLAKAAQVVRVAGGLLDTPGGASHLAAVLSAADLDPPDEAASAGGPRFGAKGEDVA
jgi:hypothetical protein